MTQGQMIGALCAALAVVEVVVGFLVVLPKAPEQHRQTLTTAILTGAFFTVAVGVAMFFEWIPVGSPPRP